LGEEDIYYSLKDKASGNWSTPKTVGNTINTKGFEISPFLSVTGDTLFFSSNGHGGFGDADIFYSVKQGSWDNWAAPVNLGYKVNSAKFDAYFSYSANDVFWSSNRDSKYADIYTSKPFIITPIIAEAKGTDVTVFKGNDGKIDLKVSGGKAPYDFTWSNGVKVQNPATLIKGEYMVLIKDVWNQEVELTVVINEPLPVKQDLEEIIYFDLDKYALNEENVSTLNSFLVQLKGKENYTLEIVSHCDQRASESYNIRLSKNRLNTVNKYLLKNGVSKQIIQGQYKGKSSLLIDCDNCTDDEYRKNRRTTIKVVMK
jgi:outer membrane protein OmpA-like peptidoglycan-associated protein